MTSTGYLLVPLMLLAILSRPGWVIVALFVSAIFADASIANPGGRSIPVGWFFALLVIGRVGCEIVLGRGRLRDDVLIRMLPLALFLVSCIVSLLSALVFFEGRVIVLPGSAGLQQVLAGPFQFQPENVNQLIYLGLIFGLVYATAHLSSSLPEREIPIWIDRAMRWSCSIASAVTLWHIASFTYDVTFPADFFHSDVSSKAWDQGLLDDLRRPSGPFSRAINSRLFLQHVLVLFLSTVPDFGGSCKRAVPVARYLHALDFNVDDCLFGGVRVHRRRRPRSTVRQPASIPAAAAAIGATGPRSQTAAILSSDNCTPGRCFGRSFCAQQRRACDDYRHRVNSTRRPPCPMRFVLQSIAWHGKFSWKLTEWVSASGATDQAAVY